MKISLVVVVDELWGIGIRHRLLCHLPADLKHFKHVTMGKPVLMGRKTFESIGLPLKGRQNIVLTRQSFKRDDIDTVNSLDQAWALLKGQPEVMVIGGAQIFEQTIALADEVYLTQIHHQFKADAFFPKLVQHEWHSMQLGGHEADEKNAYSMSFYLYTKKKRSGDACVF